MRSPSSGEPSYLPKLDDKAKRARQNLPFEVSDLVARHLTLVTDPEDIASEVEYDRKRKFHNLIQKYVCCPLLHLV